MADNLTTLGLLTLAQTFRGDVVRQINRMVQFLKFVPIVRGEGKNVSWVPESDGALAENYSEGADATNFGGDSQASAVLQWALYRANPHVTQLAMDGSATSYDPKGNLQYWARTLVNHASKLAKLINGKCFAGPGTGTEIAGLDVAIGDDANTYATIDRTDPTNAFWKPTVITAAAAPTFALLRDDVRLVYEASGENPDVAFCSPAVFNTIGGLFDATRRNIEVATTARGSVRLDFGFQALELDGMIIMKDVDATAGSLYYINTSKVELQVLPSAEQRMLLEQTKVQVNADDGFGEVPLGFQYEMLAKTGPSSKAEILSTCQLVVKRPNACGVRKNIVTA